MTPVYLNQPAHSFPLVYHHQEEDKSHLCFSSHTNQDPNCSVSCPTSSSMFEEDSGPRDIGKQRRHNQEARIINSSSRSLAPDMDDWSSVNCGHEYEKDKEEEINRSSHKGYSSSSAKWLMQKMKPTNTCPDSSSTDSHKASGSYGPTWHHQRCRSSNYKYNNNGKNMTRVCADCSTTSTPLWRSGPNGPKSLCNACGIRRRKARKAMEEEAGGWCAKTRIVHDKELKKATQVMVKNNSHQCEGKREVMALQDFEFTLTGNSVLQPRDEVLEGAMLLMDLSCAFFPF